jgi:colicin import membrane protein
VAAPRLEQPPAPTPAPPPRPEPPAPKAATPPAVSEAQIAIERDRKAREEREKEREKAEADKKKREADAEKKRELDEKRKRDAAEKAEKADQARLDKLREEQLKRMQGTLSGSGSPTSTGTAAVDAAPSAGYAGRLIAHIRPNIVFSETLPGNPAADVEVRAAPGGTIISRRLIKGSGFKDWDEAVLRAIDKSGTLPRDTDGRVPSTIIITFKRNE